MQQEFDPTKFENKGEFDYFHLEMEDPLKKRTRAVICEYRNKQPNPRPFIIVYDQVTNVTGSADGRLWVSIKGNLHMVLSYPLKMFKTYFDEEVFPLFLNYAVIKTMNYFAPGQFMIKFSNDVVCKEHRCKVGGIMNRRDYGYATLMLGANFVEAPKGEELRRNGIKACCMKNHCANPPTTEEYAFKLYEILMGLLKELDTIDKLVDYQNKFYNEYENNYKMTINNPNADLEKDGTFWTTEYPHALFKVDHAGMRYQYYKSEYDPIYFDVKGDPNKPKPYHIPIEHIKVEEGQ